MVITFHEILKHLEEYDIGKNQIPPIIIPGGEYYPIDLEERKKTNKQMVIVAHEILNTEKYNVAQTIEDYMKEKLGDQILSYKFDDIKEVEKIVDEFSTHFNIQLEKEQIIRLVNNKKPKPDSYFYVFIAILELPFYT